jgi:hypothetical protein
MKVKELIKILSSLEQDYTILMASDEEGNSYGTLVNGCIAMDKSDKTVTLFPDRQSDDIEELLHG